MHVLELRGHQSLASRVIRVAPPLIEIFGSGLGTANWVRETNPLELWAVRFLEPKLDQFALESVFRFRKAGAEPQAFARALREKHARLLKLPDWKMFGAAVENVVVECSGLDFTLNWSVGDVGEVVRILQNVVLARFGARRTLSYLGLPGGRG